MLMMSLIMAAVLIVAVCACLAGWLATRRLATHEQQHQQQLQALRAEFTALNETVIGLGQALLAMEKKLQLAPSDQGVDASDDYYRRMLQSGVDPEQLTDRLGIPAAEARLLNLLRSQSRQPN